MSQLFKPAANSLAQFLIYTGAALPFLILITGSQISRSPANTQVDVPLDQPVPFSHRHHVWELGIDCRFCHHTVEQAAHSAVPSTEVCMTCHSQIWTNSPLLEPVRNSYETGTPLVWNRVNKLPEFVYFDHSIHIARGINCNNCHGAVHRMHITWKGRAFSMAWCLECHRAPEEYMLEDPTNPNATPRELVFAVYDKFIEGAPLSPVEQRLDQGLEQRSPRNADQGMILVNNRGINTSHLADCYICHR